MNYIYFILFSVFTLTKAIICPSHYLDNLCLIIEESEEKEIDNNDYCLECTYKYRKCKETDNFDNIYCNPVNGLCELNETEFNTIYDFDIDNKKENIICTNFTYQKKGNNNELKYSLIVICVILFVCCILMLLYIIYNKYYKNKQNKFIEEREINEYKNSEANYDNENDKEADCVMEIELDSDDRPKYTDNITESIIKL